MNNYWYRYCNNNYQVYKGFLDHLQYNIYTLINLFQLDQLIDSTEQEYHVTALPADVVNAEGMLNQHDAKKQKIEEIINFSSQEGEQIVVRVRQQVC